MSLCPRQEQSKSRLLWAEPPTCCFHIKRCRAGISLSLSDNSRTAPILYLPAELRVRFFCAILHFVQGLPPSKSLIGVPLFVTALLQSIFLPLVNSFRCLFVIHWLVPAFNTSCARTLSAVYSHSTHPRTFFFK